jgi:hypothetical protein
MRKTSLKEHPHSGGALSGRNFNNGTSRRMRASYGQRNGAAEHTFQEKTA